MLAQALVVDPHFRPPTDPRKAKKQALLRPALRNLDLPPIPPFADEVVANLVGVRAITLVGPDARHADGAIGRRRVAGERHLRQLRAGPIPPVGFSPVVGIGGEVPHAVEVHPEPWFRPTDRSQHTAECRHAQQNSKGSRVHGYRLLMKKSPESPVEVEPNDGNEAPPELQLLIPGPPHALVVLLQEPQVPHVAPDSLFIRRGGQ